MPSCSAVAGLPRTTPSTSRTTTRSGACRRTTSGICSRCSSSRARRPASRGRPSSASATGYRRAFAGFDVEAVARFGQRDVERLLADPGIVRNRLKVESAVANAKATIAVGGLDELLWSFVGGEPRVNHWRKLAELPAETDESRAMSKELKRRGFRFVGPTICYSLMQACGLVNDHVVACFRYAEVGESGPVSAG